MRVKIKPVLAHEREVFANKARQIKEFESIGNLDQQRQAILELVELLNDQNIYGASGWTMDGAGVPLSILDHDRYMAVMHAGRGWKGSRDAKNNALQNYLNTILADIQAAIG